MVEEPATVTRVPPPPEGWYRPVASHLGSTYLRYAFTKGTVQEVDFLWEALGLEPGQRLLDVGMGPGRHALELARRGLEVVGIDISEEFVALAKARARQGGLTASFYVMDAKDLPFEEEFDRVISICEGAFSLGGDDLRILRGISRALRPAALVAVGAVNVFYVVTYLREEGHFDPASMLYRESVEVVGEAGGKRIFEMWNSCYTPRELRWMANGADLRALQVHGISPGAYARQPPTREHPELLLLAQKEEKKLHK